LRAELDALGQRLAESVEVQEELRAAVRRAQETVQAQQRGFAEQEARLQDALGSYEASAREQLTALQARERQLAEEQKRLEAREAELRRAVADVQQRIGRSGSAWMVAEAAYLMHLAKHRLELARDALTARAALELADERLRDTLDPRWAGVRETLQREREALAALDWPDLDVLADRLDGLIAQVPELEPPPGGHQAPARVAAPPAPVAATGEERTWNTLVDDFVSGVRDAVRIRRSDQPVEPLPLAGEHELRRRNMTLRLEAARVALALGEAGMYRSSLEAARDALDRYFRADTPLTRSMRAALGELATVDIRPLPPAGFGEALRQLEAARAARQAGVAVPGTVQ
jgi:uroporphyrin-3 C-methyltransferase